MQPAAATEATPPQSEARLAPRVTSWLAPRGAPWVAALGTFLIALPLLWMFYQRHPLLYDTDASYHLAIARMTAEQGIVRELPQVRMSALTLYGFSDNVLLFHLALAPFVAAADDPLAGGRFALALLDALVLAAIAGLGVKAVGWWGSIAALAVGLGSLEVFWRLVRLRPELLALLILLLALAAAGTRRYRTVGALAAVFALAYVAWHAFLGLFLLLFLFTGWVRRRWEWPLALYPVLGTGLGLVVHPAFPTNLVIWKLAAIDVFAFKGSLDSGTELGAQSLQVMLLANLGFWLVAAILWRSRRPAAAELRGVDSAAQARDLADAFGLAAFCFAVLYVMVSRFSIYAFPLALLWLLFATASRGETPGGRVRLPWRGSLPIAPALVVALLLAAPGTSQELARFARRTDPGLRNVRLADYAAFGRAVPAGAKVAAPWGETSLYLLWAPQGRYLNVLDPAAMAVPFPRAAAAQRELFAGDAEDVPLAAVSELDSRFVAWSQPGAPPRLLARLQHDPRARPLHLGFQALFALDEPPPGSFVLDWRVVPRGALPPSADAPFATWPVYPRLPQPELRAMEGFVDAGRVAAASCVAFAREQAAGDPGLYELAPNGATKLWADGKPLLDAGGNGAVLGEGVTFELPAAQRLVVLTCPGEDGRAGFYLLRRG